MENVIISVDKEKVALEYTDLICRIKRNEGMINEYGFGQRADGSVFQLYTEYLEQLTFQKAYKLILEKRSMLQGITLPGDIVVDDWKMPMDEYEAYIKKELSDIKSTCDALIADIKRYEMAGSATKTKLIKTYLKEFIILQKYIDITEQIININEQGKPTFIDQLKAYNA